MHPRKRAASAFSIISESDALLFLNISDNEFVVHFFCRVNDTSIQQVISVTLEFVF